MTTKISVVAIPTLMDQDLTFMEGIEASVRCVARNFRVMLLWAVILTLCVLVGVLTFYLAGIRSRQLACLRRVSALQPA